MRINTRTGRIELTKRERETLANAKTLLLQIAKHGDGAVCDMADGAADEVGNVQASIAKVEPEEKSEEIVKAPY